MILERAPRRGGSEKWTGSPDKNKRLSVFLSFFTFLRAIHPVARLFRALAASQFTRKLKKSSEPPQPLSGNLPRQP
jgi:hypothetical protein